MRHSGKEPAKRKEPSAKSLNELMELLLKLNARLRNKISPQQKKEETGGENMEMVIIILNNSSESIPRAPRTEKPASLKVDWIEDLCKEIERGSWGRKDST